MTKATNIEDWLGSTTALLQAAGIGTARLDSLVLLEDCLSKDRTQLLAHGDQKLSREHIQVLNDQVQRRAKHEPLAYIRGKTEFYGRCFMISSAVLEPRPETETMIDLLQELACDWQRTTIIDVGTGSGALAVTAKLELPAASVIAIDIDAKCLEVARSNAQSHDCTIDFKNSDLLAGFELPANSAILANLPYVPDSYKLNRAAMNEPRLAIFGGANGLDLYRRMFEQISVFKQGPTAILTEALPVQHQALASIATANGYKLAKTNDFIQVYFPGT